MACWRDWWRVPGGEAAAVGGEFLTQSDANGAQGSDEGSDGNAQDGARSAGLGCGGRRAATSPMKFLDIEKLKKTEVTELASTTN